MHEMDVGAMATAFAHSEHSSVTMRPLNSIAWRWYTLETLLLGVDIVRDTHGAIKSTT